MNQLGFKENYFIKPELNGYQEKQASLSQRLKKLSDNLNGLKIRHVEQLEIEFSDSDQKTPPRRPSAAYRARFSRLSCLGGKYANHRRRAPYSSRGAI
jgi:hypothetical protein